MGTKHNITFAVTFTVITFFLSKSFSYRQRCEKVTWATYKHQSFSIIYPSHWRVSYSPQPDLGQTIQAIFIMDIWEPKINDFKESKRANIFIQNHSIPLQNVIDGNNHILSNKGFTPFTEAVRINGNQATVTKTPFGREIAFEKRQDDLYTHLFFNFYLPHNDETLNGNVLKCKKQILNSIAHSITIY